MKKVTTCTICRQSDKLVVAEKRLSLYHCGNCNHTFTFVSKPVEKYDSKYFLYSHRNWFIHPNLDLFEEIYQTILPLVGNKKISMLDVGCGTGDLLKYIASKRIKSTLAGIDLAPNDRYRGIRFIKGDFYKTSIKGKFNSVCTLGTIEHIERPNLFVRKIANLITDDGILLVMTIDSSSLIYRVAGWFHRIGFSVAYNQLFSDHHLQHYTKASLKYLLEQNGFEVVSQKNHNFPLKSVDVPKHSVLPQTVYLLLTAVIFTFSSLIGQGMLQTVVCRKKLT